MYTNVNILWWCSDIFISGHDIQQYVSYLEWVLKNVMSLILENYMATERVCSTLYFILWGTAVKSDRDSPLCLSNIFRFQGSSTLKYLKTYLLGMEVLQLRQDDVSIIVIVDSKGTLLQSTEMCQGTKCVWPTFLLWFLSVMLCNFVLTQPLHFTLNWQVNWP